MTPTPLSLLRPLVDRFPRIASLYRTVRDQWATTEEPLATPWGFTLSGNPSMASGQFEPDETRLIRALLRDVDLLVNVGANIGYYCCHALSMGKRVIAFEPVPRNVRYLCSNVRANNWTDIEIYPMALTNSPGVLELYGGNTGASRVKGWAGIPASYVTLVPATTLDAVLGARLGGRKTLILVDIEGGEKWMLEGALNTIAAEQKPVWIVEILSTEFQPEGVRLNPHLEETFHLFFRHGYHAYTADSQMRMITAEEVELIARGISHPATHNFMFCTERPVP